MRAFLCHCAIVLISASMCALSQAQPLRSAQLEIIRGKPFVPVMVNGKGPFRFVIDTGTGGEAFVTRELAQRLALPVTGQARVSDPSGQGQQRAPIVTIGSLQVAGVEFHGVKAVEHTLSDGDGPCDGLLGFKLFRDHLLTLDFPNRRMELAEGALVRDGGKGVLPFRAADGVPVIALRVDGTQIDALIDSGGAGLSLPEALAARLRFEADPVEFSHGESLSTRFQIKAARLAGEVGVGRYKFDRPFLEINPAFPLADFGSSAMQDFALTFDQRSGLVRFASRKKSLRLAATPPPLGLNATPPPRPADPSLVPVG